MFNVLKIRSWTPKQRDLPSVSTQFHLTLNWIFIPLHQTSTALSPVPTITRLRLPKITRLKVKGTNPYTSLDAIVRSILVPKMNYRSPGINNYTSPNTNSYTSQGRYQHFTSPGAIITRIRVPTINRRSPVPNVRRF